MILANSLSMKSTELQRSIRELRQQESVEFLQNCKKSAGQAILLWLKMLFDFIWRTESVLSSWQKGLILPLCKCKGSKWDCHNYCNITLLSVLEKVFASVLLAQPTHSLKSKRRLHSRSFYNGVNVHSAPAYWQGTRIQVPCSQAFVDIQVTFDSVDTELFWLKLTGLLDKLYRMIHLLYDDSSSSCKQEKNHRLLNSVGHPKSMHCHPRTLQCCHRLCAWPNSK